MQIKDVTLLSTSVEEGRLLQQILASETHYYLQCCQVWQ